MQQSQIFEGKRTNKIIYLRTVHLYVLRGVDSNKLIRLLFCSFNLKYLT